MSLIDTIKAAREEAEEAGTLLGSKKDKNATAATTTSDQEGQSTGFSRRSAARAKPTRELAGTVHKTEEQMTKAEKQAARQAKREEEDLLLDAKKAVLESREDYRHTQRIWWIMVICGLAASVAAFLIMRYMQSSGVQSTALANLSMASMAIAYLLIIGAFIYDIRKVRPLRKQADEKILGMSKRKLKRVVEEDEERKAAKKAQKAKR